MINSVIAQTHTNWELLLIDDCSTDNTVEIIESYAAKDKRIKLFKRDKNYGMPSFGRNYGLKQAKGDYITFLDHDDLFAPDKLKRCLEVMQKEKLDFLVSNIFKLNDISGQVDGKAWSDVRNYEPERFSIRLLSRNFVPPNSTMIRSDMFKKVGDFDVQLKGTDDYDMWYRISRVGLCGVLNEPLAYWRYKNSVSISADDYLMVENELKFYEKVLQNFELDEEKKVVLNSALLRQYRFFANRSLLRGQFDKAEKYYHRSGLGKIVPLIHIAPKVFRFLYIIRRKKLKPFPEFVLDFKDLY